jgi:hypothetical protein
MALRQFEAAFYALFQVEMNITVVRAVIPKYYNIKLGFSNTKITGVFRLK